MTEVAAEVGDGYFMHPFNTARAMDQAGVSHADIDLFELHDAYTVTTTPTRRSGSSSRCTGRRRRWRRSTA